MKNNNNDNYEIYMLTNEDMYGRCPVLGGKNQPLQAVWEAQKAASVTAPG